MKYKEGDKVRCKLSGFEKDNVWIVDSILTNVKPKKSLYLCYKESDKRKTLFQFLEGEVESIQ